MNLDPCKPLINSGTIYWLWGLGGGRGHTACVQAGPGSPRGLLGARQSLRDQESWEPLSREPV